MPPGRDSPDLPPVEPRGGAWQSRNVVSADVLMQMFLDVCCDELLLYYAASGAVLRSNCNFGIRRHFTGKYLPYLIRAAATLQNPPFMLRTTLLVLLCRTWCVRRCNLSAGFISPHLVYAILGASMPQHACSLSSPQLRAHVQPQRDLWF